jgi:biopolymer transport protein ExbB
MWDTILLGGAIMVPLGLCSVIGLGIIIERSFSMRRIKIIPPEIVRILENIQSRDDIKLAWNMCNQNAGVFANIVRVGLESIELSRAEIKEALEDQGRQEVRTLEKGMVILETVAGIAPLLGLLGTVLGMREVFGVISLEGLGGTAQLSGGISQALITTIFGLSIGILALVFYNFYSKRAENLISEIEMYSIRLVNKLHHLQANNEPVLNEGDE